MLPPALSLSLHLLSLLGTCEDFEHLHFLRGMSDQATALLIECRGDTAETLQV